LPTTVTYLFDPLCGWCYGASPVIQRLGQQANIQMELAPTGLFAGGGRTMDAAFADFAWSNDQRIAKLTGQRFTEAYRQNVLGLDTCDVSVVENLLRDLELIAAGIVWPQTMPSCWPPTLPASRRRGD